MTRCRSKLFALILFALAAAASGCAPAAKAPAAPSASRSVTLDAFTSPGAVADATTIEQGPSMPGDEPVVQNDEAANREPGVDVETPPVPAPPPVQLALGERVVLDSLVGQINGRPVFADAFFDPIDAQLRAQRRQLSPLAFDEFLKQTIGSRLWTIVQSELMLSQAQARLTPDMQQGLFAWLREREEDIISQSRGSRAQAIEQLKSESGIDLGVALQETRDIALIQLLIDQEIKPRIIVSWKDVQREYERRAAEFNPPGRARIARIFLDPERDAESVEIVRRRLLDGDDFQEIAEAVGMRDRGEFGAYQVGFDGLRDIQEPIIDLYRQQLATLDPGETSTEFRQPLSSGGEWIVWLHVIEIDQPPRRSLYDPQVQLFLRDELVDRERTVEQDRYFRKLLADNISDDIEQMAQRLYQVAVQRYVR